MTAPWEEYAAPAGPWEEYSNSAEAQPYTGTGIRQTAKRTALGTLKDTGVALAKGVVGAGEAAVGLADIVTPGNLGEGLRKHVGYDPAVAQQFLSSQYSQPQQEAIQRVEDAEGFTGTVKAALQNPSVIASTVGESLPSMIGGQFLARAGLRTLPRAAAALGTYAPVVAGALGEGAVTAGSMQENIRQQAGDTTLAQKGAALAAGAGTALLGAVGGRIAQKFGFIDPDTFLLSIGSKQTTPGVIKRIIGGGISESVFEEMPQSAQEQVWLNAATGKPLTEGLGESVALGGLAGAAMGAGFNVMQPRTQEKLDTVQQRTLSNLIKGAQVSVSGGVATIVEEGKPPVTMQVRDLAEHLAAGGTMDTLTPEQRFGKDVAEKTQFLGSQPAVVGRPETAVGDVQADIFGREALAYNQERNRPRGLVTGEGQGIRSRVPGRTAEEVAAEEAAYQNQPINVPPGAEQGLRAIASGATTVPAFQRDEDVVTAPMAAQADIYNKDRNRPRGLVTPAKSEQQPAVSRVPGVSAEEVLAAEQAYQTGQEPAQAPKPITRSDGKPFSTERTAGVAMKRLGLKAEEVEVRPVAGGFVIIPKEKVNGSVRDTEESSGQSSRGAEAGGGPGRAGSEGQGDQTSLGREGSDIGREQAPALGSREAQTGSAAEEEGRGLQGQSVQREGATQETGAVRDTGSVTYTERDEARYQQIRNTPPLQRTEADIAWANGYSAWKSAPTRAKESAVAQEKEVAIKDTDGFAEEAAAESAMRQKRIQNALNKELSFNGELMSRKNAIRKMVAEGYIVSQEEGQRALKSKDGTYLLESQISKTGLDYAEFLLLKRDSISNTQETSSMGDPDSSESAKIQIGVEGKTVTQAIQFLINNAPSPSYKLIAEKVRAAIQRMSSEGVNFELKVAHLGDQVPRMLITARGVTSTFFDKKPLKVDVWLNGADVTGKVGVSYETALHELVHAATQAALHLGNMVGNKGTPTQKTVSDLFAVSNKIIAHFNNRVTQAQSGGEPLTEFEERVFSKGANALRDQHEILAWALSNKDMQDYLETIPYKSGVSMWSAFVSAVRTFLGLDASADTALSEVLRLGEELMLAPVNQLLEAVQATGTTTQTQTTASQISSAQVQTVADGALKAGQQKVTSMVQSLTNPKSRLHELAVQYAPQWLSVTPLITLVQTFGKKIQQVKDFARHIDGVVATKTDIVDTAKVLYDKAIKLAQAGPGEKAFNYAAAVASFNRMRPWEGLFDQDWVPKTGTKEERLKMANVAWKRAGMDVATGKKLHEAHKEAVAAYEALGSEEVKQAYIAIVEDLKRVRAREKNNLLSYIEAATEGNPEMRAQLMARFNATFSELQGAYWPLARVGDFRLSFTDKDGAKVVKHYVTMKERRTDKEQLIADGIPAESFVEDYKDKRTRNETAIPQELMNQLAGAVEAEYLKGVDLDDADAVASAREAAQDVVSDMNQIWLRWQPETSALKNSLRRKNTRGFSEDMMRSYLDYMSRHASNIAWTEQGRKIEQDLKSLADDIKEAQTAPGADTTMQRHILNDLRARVQAIRTARVGPVASGLGKLGTAYYMTSPSIALVQMSQLGVITLPKLATQFGWRRASKALAAGTKAAFTQAFTRKAIFEDPAVGNVFDNIRAVVTAENRDLPQAKDKALGDRLYTKQEMLRQIEGLTPYQQQLLALREATARNLLDISAAHEAYELTQGKDPNGPGSKVFRYAMLPMQLSELASRKAAVLSTFDLANQDGKNFFDAMNDVSSVVNDTLYSYAKEHKGAALQGGAPRVLLQFQHYRIMTGIRLAQLFLNSVKGETPEVKTAARKELAGIMGMAGALGGSMGLPAAGVVFAIMNALLGTDDEPYDSELEWRNWLQENLGQTMGNVATTGLPYLLGADISRRVGMGDIFGMQQQPPPGVHGKQLAAWWAASMLGPVASVGQSWFQGYDEFSKGNYMKSLEVSTPKPIRDALKAYRVGTEGLKTSAGKKLLADEAIGADEVMLLALGFNADEVAQAQAAERSLGKMSTMISERRGKLIKAAARGILEGDTRDALGDVLEFNRRMPRFAVNGGDIKSAVRKQITGELGVTGPRDQAVADQWEIPSYL